MFSGKYAKLSIRTGNGIAYVNLPQTLTSGLVLIEFDVKLKASSQGYNGVVVNAVDPATDHMDRLVGIFTRPTVQYSGNLEFVIYKDANGYTTWYDTSVAGDGSEHHVRIEIDLTNKVINAYVDENQVLNNVGYQGSCNSNRNQVAAIIISLGGSSNTDSLNAFIDNISVTRDTTSIYSEDFEDETVEQAPIGWSTADPGNTGSNPSIVVEELAANPPPFILPAGNEITVSVRCTPDNNTFGTCTQHVHPTILDFLNKLPNGYEYLLAITPYPGGDARYENPSIVFSNDLSSWSEDGVSNPIVPRKGNHDADPHLVWDPVNKRILLYYCWKDTDGTWYIGVRESKDGVNWGEITDNLLQAPSGYDYISPAVVYDPGDCKFKLWYVKYNRSTYEKTVIYRESSNGINWSAEQKCSVPDPGYNGQSWSVWHLTVHKVGNEFWMMAAMNPVGLEDGAAPIHLFLFRSNDGINWKGYNAPILDTANSLSNDRLYRCDFIVKKGRLYVIYSYRCRRGASTPRFITYALSLMLRVLRKSSGTWHLALTSIDVSHIIGINDSDNVVVLEKSIC